MQTESLLLEAIRRNPDDDTPRLMWADYLDELDVTTVICSKCDGKGEVRYCDAAGDMDDEPCKSCGGNLQGGYNRGKGFIFDTSVCNRAELIRVQCELSRVGPCPATIYRPIEHIAERGNKRYVAPPPTQPKKPCGWCPVCKLHAREKELLGVNVNRWREGAVCRGCKGSKRDDWGRGSGFGMCPACFGTGDAGGLMEKFDSQDDRYVAGQPNWYHKVEYVRGTKRVFCRTSEVWEQVEVPCPHCIDSPADWETNVVECRRCDSTGVIDVELRLTDWAARVCKFHPDVVELWVDGPGTEPVGLANRDWQWFANDNEVTELGADSGVNKLLWPIAVLLTGAREVEDTKAFYTVPYLQRTWTYDSKEQAQIALARAAARWVRDNS
jgi:uncharacterized protein (TIGR02996 family)